MVRMRKLAYESKEPVMQFFPHFPPHSQRLRPRSSAAPRPNALESCSPQRAEPMPDLANGNGSDTSS